MMPSNVKPQGETITMPAPSAIPIFASTGIALMAVGVATSIFISAVGLVILIGAIVNWAHLTTPGSGEIEMPLVPPEQRAAVVVPFRRRIAPPHAGLPAHRSVFPVRSHSHSSGIVGGLFGCGMMTTVALIHARVTGHSIWYHANLFASVFLKDIMGQGISDLDNYHPRALIIAAVAHVSISILVGMVFSVLLPMLPKSPVVWGGLVIPLLWSSIIHTAISVLNPEIARHIDWLWFVVAQITFGLTVGIYISKNIRRIRMRKRNQQSTREELR